MNFASWYILYPPYVYVWSPLTILCALPCMPNCQWIVALTLSNFNTHYQPHTIYLQKPLYELILRWLYNQVCTCTYNVSRVSYHVSQFDCHDHGICITANAAFFQFCTSYPKRKRISYKDFRQYYAKVISRATYADMHRPNAIYFSFFLIGQLILVTHNKMCSVLCPIGSFLRSICSRQILSLIMVRLKCT